MSIFLQKWATFQSETDLLNATNLNSLRAGQRAIIFNTLRPSRNGRHFAYNIFNCIFLNKNVWIPIKISLKFVPKGPINNIPALVQIMVWRRPGDKPLSEPMMVSLLTYLCVTRPQWVKTITSIFLSNENYLTLQFHLSITGLQGDWTLQIIGLPPPGGHTV